MKKQVQRTDRPRRTARAIVIRGSGFIGDTRPADRLHMPTAGEAPVTRRFMTRLSVIHGNT